MHKIQKSPLSLDYLGARGPRWDMEKLPPRYSLTQEGSGHDVFALFGTDLTFDFGDEMIEMHEMHLSQKVPLGQTTKF